MWTQLYRIDGPWPGRLALAARPRSGEWIGEEVGNWKKAGIASVLSLLTPQEEKDLDLQNERREVRAQGIEFTSLPIPDRDVPSSEANLATILEKLDHKSIGRQKCCHTLPPRNWPKWFGGSVPARDERLESKSGGGEGHRRARHCRAGNRGTKTLA